MLPITATIGLLDKAEGQKSNLTHDSQPSCRDLVRFGRKIRPRRSRNATQTPPPRFGSAFSLILGLEDDPWRQSRANTPAFYSLRRLRQIPVASVPAILDYKHSTNAEYQKSVRGMSRA